jgi:hypothetical protein
VERISRREHGQPLTALEIWKQSSICDIKGKQILLLWIPARWQGELELEEGVHIKQTNYSAEYRRPGGGVASGTIPHISLHNTNNSIKVKIYRKVGICSYYLSCSDSLWEN